MILWRLRLQYRAGHTTVNEQRDAGDVRGCRGEQERGSRAELLGRAQPSHRDQRQTFVARLFKADSRTQSNRT